MNFSPSSRSTVLSHPILLINCESNNFLGFPSGFDLSNDSSPSEMDDLQNYITTQGYDVLIAGDDRSAKGIRIAKEKLGIQSSSSEESE